MAGHESGHDTTYVLWQMPLKEVFVWEHVYLERKGATCTKAGARSNPTHMMQMVMGKGGKRKRPQANST